MRCSDELSMRDPEMYHSCDLPAAHPGEHRCIHEAWIVAWTDGWKVLARAEFGVVGEL